MGHAPRRADLIATGLAGQAPLAVEDLGNGRYAVNLQPLEVILNDPVTPYYLGGVELINTDNGVMPCAADFDESGFVDSDDVGAFVRAFEFGGDDADFDQSGFVDLDDYIEFVRAFEEGC